MDNRIIMKHNKILISNSKIKVITHSRIIEDNRIPNIRIIQDYKMMY